MEQGTLNAPIPQEYFGRWFGDVTDRNRAETYCGWLDLGPGGGTMKYQQSRGVGTGTLLYVSMHDEYVELEEAYSGPSGGSSTGRLVLRLSGTTLECRWYPLGGSPADYTCSAHLSRC